MISIVISSHRANYLKAIKKSIEETIGVIHEIISIDNTNLMGICEAYNKGASKAVFPYICFVHEDVLFHTKNWGTNIITHFSSDAKIGMLAILGSKYKSLAPSSWFVPYDKYNLTFPSHNIIQRNESNQTTWEYKNPFGEKRTKVATADGVWLCCRKDIWSKVGFDEKLIKGFHGYDIDFSLSVNQYADVVVVYDILLEHFSLGKYDRKWIDAIYKVHKKWKCKLPLNFRELKIKEYSDIENDTRDFFITMMYKNNFSPYKILVTIWGFGSIYFFQLGKFLLRNKSWFRYLKKYYLN